LPENRAAERPSLLLTSALAEIRDGRKQTVWMMAPQLLA
jgi:uncharacterized protein (DUF1810 family)